MTTTSPARHHWAGTTLDNGALVVSLTWFDSRADRNDGVVLCYWKSSPDPYVTWSVTTVRTPDNAVRLEPYFGHYFDSLVAAATDYAKRGGR